MTRSEYIETMADRYSRRELLKSCRMVGLTAHKLLTNEQLAEMLWQAKEEVHHED